MYKNLIINFIAQKTNRYSYKFFMMEKLTHYVFYFYEMRKNQQYVLKTIEYY